MRPYLASRLFRHRSLSGFTLIESMVVLAIVAIIATFAVPSFQATLDRQRVATVAADLHASVVLARAEAIRRNLRIEIRPTSSTGWKDGWQVVRPVSQFQATEEVMYDHAPVPAGVDVTPDPSLAAEASLSYDGTGKSGLAASPSTPHFGYWLVSIHDRPQALQRKVMINLLGRPSVCNPEQQQPPC